MVIHRVLLYLPCIACLLAALNNALDIRRVPPNKLYGASSLFTWQHGKQNVAQRAEVHVYHDGAPRRINQRNAQRAPLGDADPTLELGSKLESRPVQTSRQRTTATRAQRKYAISLTRSVGYECEREDAWPELH